MNLNDDLNMNDDPFVHISIDEKITIVQFLIHYQQPVIQALRVTGQHQHVSVRDSNEMHKSADTLCLEFLAHKCLEAYLILRSEAMLVRFNPPLLTSSETLNAKNLSPSQCLVPSV
jgi:adenosylmethionine-8-amino-7-oxononanoate aminotransferase